MFQHDAMIIRLLQLPHLLLMSKQVLNSTDFRIGLKDLLSRMCSPHLVFDFPPRQLTNQELHQHVEQRPQVIVPAHFLSF